MRPYHQTLRFDATRLNFFQRLETQRYDTVKRPDTFQRLNTGVKPQSLALKFYSLALEAALYFRLAVNPGASGDTTPCRMTGVALHSHVR